VLVRPQGLRPRARTPLATRATGFPALLPTVFNVVKYDFDYAAIKNQL